MIKTSTKHPTRCVLRHLHTECQADGLSQCHTRTKTYAIEGWDAYGASRDYHNRICLYQERHGKPQNSVTCYVSYAKGEGHLLVVTRFWIQGEVKPL